MRRELRMGGVWCRGDGNYVLDGRGGERGSGRFALGWAGGGVDQLATP